MGLGLACCGGVVYLSRIRLSQVRQNQAYALMPRIARAKYSIRTVRLLFHTKMAFSGKRASTKLSSILTERGEVRGFFIIEIRQSLLRSLLFCSPKQH